MKKKNAIKKLQLSRETLQALTSSDCQKAVGAAPESCATGGQNDCSCDTQSKGAC